MGTAAMSALLLLPRWLGIGKIDVIPAVGALITGKDGKRAFDRLRCSFHFRNYFCLHLLGPVASDEDCPWSGGRLAWQDLSMASS